MFYCPKLPKDSNIIAFLRALGIDWPTAPADLSNEEQEEQILKALENSLYREEGAEKGRKTCRGGGGGKKVEEEEENDGALRINLKRVFQEEGLLGYDPSLGTCIGESKHKSIHSEAVGCVHFIDPNVLFLFVFCRYSKV